MTRLMWWFIRRDVAWKAIYVACVLAILVGAAWLVTEFVTRVLAVLSTGGGH